MSNNHTTFPTSLSDSALSLALSEWSQQQNHLVCVITSDALTAQKIHDEIAFFNPHLPLIVFPDRETLPYDRFSPHQDIISERLAALSKLNTLKKGVFIAALPTILHRLPPYHFIAAHSFNLAIKDILDIDIFRMRLQQGGYHCVTKVMEHGEYAIRGAIIDIYPMGSLQPFRIDLFDNEIDSIRLFDVDSQCSSEKVERIQLLPAREFPLDDAGIAHFRRAWCQHFERNPTNCPLYNAVTDGIAPAGIEYYLPLFFDNSATIIDYFPPQTSIFFIGDKETLKKTADHFLHEVDLRYTQRKDDITQPLLPPNELFLSADALDTLLDTAPISITYTGNTHVIFPIDVTGQKTAKYPFDKLGRYIETAMYTQNTHILLCAHTAGRRELLHSKLSTAGIQLKSFVSWKEFKNACVNAPKNTMILGIIHGPLTSGFIASAPIITVITEAELWGETLQIQQKSSRRTIDINTMIRDLNELDIGAAVVHLEHGIGRYRGLQTIEDTMDDVTQINEFLILEYAGGDKIYVPVTSLNQISRYTGLDAEHAPLHRLGSDLWQKEKKKAQEKIHDTAAQLLEIYAKRAAREGHAYDPPDTDYDAFSAAFPFEETPDQQQAIDNVIKDMISTKPMDRLICGDVGFGKTEVAMRACFLAVQNHKQVCILAPTTLLAGQHHENFRDRFAEFGITIELLSRFRTEKATKSVLEGLSTGRIDIVIGTHKLFSKQVVFNRLGLLIVDEEHRFGVKQKEFIKALRHEVDILTLTATPIPRTLNMSLSGLRDISIMATPPLRRLAIKTFVLEKNNTLIREAILREIMRGGQVFYLYNKVASIENTAEMLKKLVPEASIQIAHGQMPERQLEKVMSDFYHQHFQVLLSSTIIENGIDIPTANTIIIDRADMFGLAQLHQLRGRVGRSHHQAYAYLLTPPPNLMTADAVKRLDAITSIEDLGAGFTLATHDMEIRGAGELLGDEQSGNMHAIGFSLYMELLNTAVEALKSGRIPELNKPANQGPEINLNMSLIIPENYISDVHTRLVLYKRIAHAENTTQLDALQVEMIDRFGLLPLSVKNLFYTMALKLTAHTVGIKKISANTDIARIEFEAHPAIKPETLIQLIQVQPKTYQLDGPSRLKYHLPAGDNQDRIKAIEQLLQRLIA